MPNAGVHLLLVQTVVDRWRRVPARAPFDMHDAAALRAFVHGSLSPDIGYFPGGDRLFSELAHLVRSADLARELIAHADSPEQQGYAWGWATHVMADGAVHPLLNEAGGEFLHGDRERPVSSTEDVLTHMRLEFGLDAVIVARSPDMRAMRWTGAVDDSIVAFLAASFSRVHGWAPAEPALAASHRMSPRLARVALALDRIHSATLRRAPARRMTRAFLAALVPPLRALPIGYRRSPLMRSVLEPIPPPEWLVRSVLEAIEAIACELDESCSSRLSGLPNRNLVTGERSADDGRDPRTLDAIRELERRRASGRR